MSDAVTDSTASATILADPGSTAASRAKLVVFLSIVVFVLEGTDAQLLAFAAPVLIKEWGLKQVDLAPALAAASGGMVLGSMLGGILGDILGRRRVMLTSLAGFGALTVLSGAVHDLDQMTILRALGGVGFGAIFPNIFALVSEVAPIERRARYVTIATLGVPLGSMVGALGAGSAMPVTGWRVCFYGAGIATLAASAALAAKLPESPAFEERRAAKREGAAVEPGRAGGWSATHPWVKGASSLCMIVQAGLRRRTLGLWLLAFSLGYVTYAFVHWGPTMLTMSGISLRLAIMSTFFLSLFMAIAPFAMAWALGRWGSRTSMLVAILIYMFATFAFGGVLNDLLGLPASLRIPAVMAALSVIGFAVGATTSCLYALSAHSYPIACRATGAGFSIAIGRLGQMATAFGSAIVLGEVTGGTTGVVVAAIVGLAVAGISTIVIDTHIPAFEIVEFPGSIR